MNKKSAGISVVSHYINPVNSSEEGSYGNQIFNKFAAPEFKEFAEKTREYYLAGYIDAAMTNTGT